MIPCWVERMKIWVIRTRIIGHKLTPSMHFLRSLKIEWKALSCPTSKVLKGKDLILWGFIRKWLQLVKVHLSLIIAFLTCTCKGHALLNLLILSNILIFFLLKWCFFNPRLSAAHMNLLVSQSASQWELCQISSKTKWHYYYPLVIGSHTLLQSIMLFTHCGYRLICLL